MKTKLARLKLGSLMGLRRFARSEARSKNDNSDACDVTMSWPVVWDAQHYLPLDLSGFEEFCVSVGIAKYHSGGIMRYRERLSYDHKSSTDTNCFASLSKLTHAQLKLDPPASRNNYSN